MSEKDRINVLLEWLLVVLCAVGMVVGMMYVLTPSPRKKFTDEERQKMRKEFKERIKR